MTSKLPSSPSFWFSEPVMVLLSHSFTGFFEPGETGLGYLADVHEKWSRRGPGLP